MNIYSFERPIRDDSALDLLTISWTWFILALFRIVMFSLIDELTNVLTSMGFYLTFRRQMRMLH